MRDPITSDDIRHHVQRMIGASGYDVDAIVEHIIRDHGLVDVGALDTADADAELSDAIWKIVWEHELPDPLAVLGRAVADARAAERKATSELRAAVIVESAEHGVPETLLASRAGVDRMTVRKWLGKQ